TGVQTCALPIWMLWHVASRLFINTYFPYPMSFKCIVLKAFGAKLGKGVVIKPKVNIKYPWYLTVENDTWIGEKVWIDNLAEVRIGQNVCLRSEEHTSELQSRENLVCRLLLEKKNTAYQ